MSGEDKKYAVLFDCDGVLVNSEEIANNMGRRHMARHYGLHYTVDQYRDRFTGISHEEFIVRVNADHMAVHGAPLPAEFDAKLQGEFEDALKTHLRQIPEVAKLLRTLDAKRIPYAVCTNANLAGTQWKLKHVGLSSYFNERVYSKDMVARPKPWPDVYLLGAAKLGVAPENCFVVEDSAVGTRAGAAAGMHVIGYTGGGHRGPGCAPELRAAGARFTTDSMNVAGTYILNRVFTPRQLFGPRPY